MSIQQEHARYTYFFLSLPIAWTSLKLVPDSFLHSDLRVYHMEPDYQSMTPKVEDSDTRITSLMADHQPPHNAVPQRPSDGEPTLLSNASLQPATPPVSQLETSMPDESVIPCPTPSDSLPKSPQNAPPPDDYQPAIVPDVHGGPQQACAPHSQDSADAHTDSGSDDDIHTTDYESSFIDPWALIVPLPESDVEEDHPSGSIQDDGVAGTADVRNQNSDVNTNSTGVGTSPSNSPNSPDAIQPSKQSLPGTRF